MRIDICMFNDEVIKIQRYEKVEVFSVNVTKDAELGRTLRNCKAKRELSFGNRLALLLAVGYL